MNSSTTVSDVVVPKGTFSRRMASSVGASALSGRYMVMIEKRRKC